MWKTYFQHYLAEKFPQFLQDKPWNYKDDLCVIGAWDLYQASGDAGWVQPVLQNAHYLMHDDGSVANWQHAESNIDKVSFGKSLRIR